MRLSHQLYYALKPYIPWRSRMALRQWQAKRIRRNSQKTWPINELAAQPPKDWRGWPDDKRFAFVITHDVEGPIGLSKVRQLAELEMRLGFRSSFNFIPEGPYRVTGELRSWLVSNGFEVGVHDLNHDGKLYQSRDEFHKKAIRINHYLKEWGAVGYRSGFMLRERDWHTDLDFRYDATSFDTDPFEPLPHGANTIFPFWVPESGKARELHEMEGRLNGRAASGYVELPYTLPQDSTLFFVLEEKSPEIWTNKLDWIASKGGMALVNVHPDYLAFDEHVPTACFPVEHYAHLLRHVRSRYAESAWCVLPRQICEHCTPKTKPNRGHMEPLSPMEEPSNTDDSARLHGRRALVLLFSEYPSDPRPLRAAEAMRDAGMKVEVICLRQTPEETLRERVDDIAVRRLPIGKIRGSKLSYLWQYSAFLTLCFLIALKRSFQKRYDIVHVHNMPDILVFSAILPKLFGARVILDLHDPMPELMSSIYGLPERHWLVGSLRVAEKLSIKFSDRVITVNQACRKIFSARSCREEKIVVVMNAPNEKLFTFVAAPEPVPKRLVIMYHGSIVERHGLDLAVKSLQTVLRRYPNATLRIFGARNSYLDSVLALAQQLGIQHAVQHMGSVSQREIVKAIDDCDIGIIPNRRSIFTEINTPTRIFEYLSRGKPVVAPDSPGITDYFSESELLYFKLGDAEDLTKAILRAAESPSATRDVVIRGQRVLLAHRWSEERNRLLAVVKELITGKPGKLAKADYAIE